jgi:hypothetical protein
VASPWDDDARGQAEGLYEAEFLICSQCGNPREMCSDPTRPWYPQRTVCYASGSLAVANRRYEKRHEHEDAEPLGRLGYRDGVRIWVSPDDLTPDDKFI